MLSIQHPSSLRRWSAGVFLLAALALITLHLALNEGRGMAAGEVPTGRPPRDAAALDKLVRYAKSEGVTFYVSLRELARDCAEHQAEGGRLPRYLRRLKNLNVFFGFALAKDDVLLLGIRDSGLPPLDVDDVAHALQAVWNNRTPMCSLEPDERDASVQRCVIGGVSEKSAFADSMIAADYLMKMIAQGKENPRLEGLKSFFDLVVANWKKDPDRVPSQNNRWWFARPKWDVPRTLVVDKRVVLLTQNPVVVLTEREAAGKKWNTGEVGAEAETFAITFTYHLGSLAKKYPSIARLLALFQLHDLMVHLRMFLKDDDDLPGKDFWLKGYRSPYDGPPESMPTLTRMAEINRDDRRATLRIRGGVTMSAMKVVGVSHAASPVDGTLRRWLGENGGE